MDKSISFFSLEVEETDGKCPIGEKKSSYLVERI